MKKKVLNLIEIASAAREVTAEMYYLVLEMLQLNRHINLQMPPPPRGFHLISYPSPRVETVDCGDEAACWLTKFLGQPCRLIRQNPNFSRDMEKRSSGGTNKYPFHLLYMYILWPGHVFHKNDQVTFSI